MIWLRRLFAFGVAVAVSAVLASLSATYFALRALLDLEVRIGFGDRLSAYGHDILGRAPLLSAIVALGYLIAFPAAALVARWLTQLRTWIFIGTGATAILVALFSMEALLTMMPIAGARQWPGLTAQGLSGAVGGLLFAKLSRRSAARTDGS